MQLERIKERYGKYRYSIGGAFREFERFSDALLGFENITVTVFLIPALHLYAQ